MPQNKMLVTDNEGQGLLFPDKESTLRQKLRLLEEKNAGTEVLLRMFQGAFMASLAMIDGPSVHDGEWLVNILASAYSGMVDEESRLKFYDMASQIVL